MPSKHVPVRYGKKRAMPSKPVPVRCGHAVALTLDVDARALLRELCPSKKAHGRFLSELIRTEQRIREERRRLRELLEDSYGETVAS